MFQYSFNLAWSDEDGGYIATVPEFPGLSGFGETPDAAVREVMEAARLTIEVMEEDGDKIPAPQKLVEYSGQTRLRMPKTLHRELAIEAQKEGVSLNSYILHLLQSNHAREKAFKDAAEELHKKVRSSGSSVSCPIVNQTDHAETICIQTQFGNIRSADSVFKTDSASGALSSKRQYN